MSQRSFITIDGNEAASLIAHQVSEVIAIYPITPASPMGEFSDAWSAAGRKNIFGIVPDVIEMQSEAGAAAAVHGSLQAGALTTTFTASQGLLLMIPNMFKIAGELLPTVFHISARTIATHALSIFGDHSDVMSTRSCGWAMLAANSVQEIHDLAMVSHAATLKSRVPFLHFFDGFRTSHEVNKIEVLNSEDVEAMLDQDLIVAFRERAMNPDKPVLRGTAQNPDVFFQAREACNPYYDAVPQIVQETMDRFAKVVGRQYHLFEYAGDPNAERVIVMMGSGVGAAEEALAALQAKGEKVGIVRVRLYRPFAVEAFIRALPSTVKQIAVLDRTKEPGALGEPLYLDVIGALFEGWAAVHKSPLPRVIGGRYGLSSKEFTPAMVVAVYDELSKSEPKRHFTVGIYDDVTHLSLKYDAEISTESKDVIRAVFYGLGSDGTVGASKNSVKIVGENTPMYAQGYFVYDSKKAGSMTVSHLRFSPRPINSTYLISRASFVACHQFVFMETTDVLEMADPGATFLLNSPYAAEEVWDKLPIEAQQTMIDKKLKFYVVDAVQVAQDAGMGGRINTVMQTCFFALSGILPREEAIEQIKYAINKTYGKRGESILRKNFAAVDGALGKMQEVKIPAAATSKLLRQSVKTDGAPDFVKKVTAVIYAGKGDLLPVSAMPIDGSFPTDTAKYEKRSIALDIPIWDPSICIDCAMCAFVCPHAAIRIKPYDAAVLAGAPATFQSKESRGKEFEGTRMTIQVAPDDCTGCGVCVEVCPAKSKEAVRHRAINMEPKTPHLENERKNYEFFLSIPDYDRTRVKIETVKGTQILKPLFEYSGACAGCGETPYIKLATQLFGDRMMIGNATGCSSIYGGNLPTTPYSVDLAGRGPTWCNSLFEDNAEFGLGFRLAVDQTREYVSMMLKDLAGQVGDDLVTQLLTSTQQDEAELAAQRARVAELVRKLKALNTPAAIKVASLAHYLVARSVWIVGGDGWAYDIGFGGLDHVLTTQRDVNLLVLDTGVYSNTGGQASKATPRGAVAKFAASGKPSRKKDLGMIAVAYGNVYVAQVAMGANPAQAVKAFREAESYKGVSLILAYSQCVAHGVNMTTGVAHQKEAVQCGFWPLYRYDPREAHEGGSPFKLDSRKPTAPFKEFAMQEARFAMLVRSNPKRAEQLFELAQRDIDDQWHYYEQMAGVQRDIVGEIEEVEA